MPRKRPPMGRTMTCDTEQLPFPVTLFSKFY